MTFKSQLFEARRVCLAPIDHEKDPEIAARWSQDAGYLRMLDTRPARPTPPALMKNQFEALEKRMEQEKNLFYFTIHQRGDTSPNGLEQKDPYNLIGFVKLYSIEWTNGTGFLQIGIGDERARGKGLGGEALELILRYAFEEINLHRLAAEVPEYNQAAQKLFSRAGFCEEVRRREALERDGRRWDMIHYGLLAAEWRARA